MTNSGAEIMDKQTFDFPTFTRQVTKEELASLRIKWAAEHGVVVPTPADVCDVYDFEALYWRQLEINKELLALGMAANIKAEKASAERDTLVRLWQQQAEELRALRAAQYREEPQAVYIAELRDASPIMAAIAVHQSQGVR